MASADSSKYAVATTGVAVGLLAGLFGFKKRNNLQKMIKTYEDRVDA
ncbi:hypothetical protein SD436_08320 [Streptococcus sp. 2A/TPW/M5]